MRKVEDAKGDGRWGRAYKGPKDMVVPEDFLDVLGREGNEGAKRYWEGLGRSERYGVVWRIETGSAKTRGKRIEGLVEGLGEGRVPGRKVEDGVEKGEEKAKKEGGNVGFKTAAAGKRKEVVRKAAEKGEVVRVPPRREGLRKRM